MTKRMCIVYTTSLPGSSVFRLFAEDAAGLTAGRWEGLMPLCTWLVVEGEAALAAGRWEILLLTWLLLLVRS